MIFKIIKNLPPSIWIDFHKISSNRMPDNKYDYIKLTLQKSTASPLCRYSVIVVPTDRPSASSIPFQSNAVLSNQNTIRTPA